MGFKRVKHDETDTTEVKPVLDLSAIPDFDEPVSAPVVQGSKTTKSWNNASYAPTMKEGLEHDSKTSPCYGPLINEPGKDSHHFARQVCAEIKIALSGLSPKQIWWCEARANFLNRRPCGLETANDTYTLSWEVDADDVEARLMLQDVREHLQWVFGPIFIVRPVGVLSQSAREWIFQYRG